MSESVGKMVDLWYNKANHIQYHPEDSVMSYDEDSRISYRADCACGKGFLRYFRIYRSNDWGQTREEFSDTEIHCEYCKENYHIEKRDYLVPNGKTLQIKEPKFDNKYKYTDYELFVKDFSKETIKLILNDMKKPGHGFISKLETEEAIYFAENYGRKWTGKKRISYMIPILESVLANYDKYMCDYSAKEKYYNDYINEEKQYSKELQAIKDQCFHAEFTIDTEHQNYLRNKEKYADFTATVTYDPYYQYNLENEYFDTYHIIKCVDPQFLFLGSGVDCRKITITKKYLCKCTVCSEEKEIRSSDFRIINKPEGYSLQVCCPCHTPSSFEVKTMDILKHLHVKFLREVTFDGLTGDSGTPLRFDFGIYQSNNEKGHPNVNLVIELQGPHHFKPGSYDEFNQFVADNNEVSSTERFNSQLKRDSLKKEYCLQNGIALEYIKYTGNYDDIMNRLIEIFDRHNIPYIDCRISYTEYEDDHDLLWESYGIK